MKIKKNLSDEEMLRGYNEKVSFENMTDGLSTQTAAIAKNKKSIKTPELLLPPEAVEKMNGFLLEISMAWLKDRKGEVVWKVQKEGDKILVFPAQDKKR